MSYLKSSLWSRPFNGLASKLGSPTSIVWEGLSNLRHHPEPAAPLMGPEGRLHRKSALHSARIVRRPHISWSTQQCTRVQQPLRPSLCPWQLLWPGEKSLSLSRLYFFLCGKNKIKQEQEWQYLYHPVHNGRPVSVYAGDAAVVTVIVVQTSKEMENVFRNSLIRHLAK